MLTLEVLAAEGPNHVTFAALATDAPPTAMQAVAAPISTAATRPVGYAKEPARRGDEERFGERFMSMVSLFKGREGGAEMDRRRAEHGICGNADRL